VNLTNIDWRDRARNFCKQHGSLEVATVEKAMRDGASLAVGCMTGKLSAVRQELETKRNKANAPQ
jgi:hypothetical protein